MKKTLLSRPVAALIFVLHLGGCTSWSPVTVSPRQFIEEEQPERIRIFHADGTRIELTDPRVEMDSITALSSVRVSPVEFRSEPVRIPLTDVRAFEVRRFSAGRTFTFVVGIPLGLMFACVGGVICGGL